MKKLIPQFALLLVILFLWSSCNNKTNESTPTSTAPTNNNSTAATNNTETAPAPTAPTPKPEAMSKKKELLTSLVGEHPLLSISAAMGANTLVDYYDESGRWVAIGSSNNGGVREEYDIDIDNDIETMNSMKVVVKEDLTVEFMSNGKAYISVPFSEDGMQYKLAKASGEYISINDEISASTNFVGENLYLYAEDKLKLEDVDLPEIFADAAILSYRKVDSSFELQLFEGECCNSSTYLFKKF